MGAFLLFTALVLPPADDPFASEIRPALERWCSGCHGGAEPKAGLDFAEFADAAAVRGDSRLWREVVAKLRAGEMPPAGKPAPSDARRGHLAAAIEAVLAAGDAPRTPLRRVSRAELSNSLRDLLSIPAPPPLPADGSGGEGFSNAAATLFTPPLFLERLGATVDAALAATKALDGRGLAAMCSDATVLRPALARFLARAYRGPVDAAEVDRSLAVLHAATAAGADPAGAMRATLKTALLSPRFVFHVEASDDFALADRLASFLWSSVADDELNAAAVAGALADSAVVEAQVRRMLADPRSRALAETFAVEWLGVDELLTTSAPGPRRFPTFTPTLRDAMYAEVVECFAELVRADEPVTALLDADFTFVNEELAAHYGIAGVAGPELRKVTLRDRARGGVLGMAAVLTATSFPLRTSPVVRGKWLLETLLGDPPPPPPQNVADLGADDVVKDDARTLRQRLEAHRADPACASCHARIDPLGFALENFDPIGRWRDVLAAQPIDARGELPDGTGFDGPVELKRVLLARHDCFVTAFARKLLGFALGRGLEVADEPAVEAIVARARAEDFRMSALIAAVCASAPFRERSRVP